MALDPKGLEAAARAMEPLAFRDSSESDGEWEAEFMAEGRAQARGRAEAAILAYLQHAGEAEPVGYVDRLSCPTTFSTHEHPGIEMPVFASPHHQAPEDHIPDVGNMVPEGWRPIETAPKDRTPVLIAVPTKDRDDHIVGEAYFDPENNEGGDWWWAGTGWGDYHAGPISEMNHHLPTHWMPLPASPSNQASASADQGGE